MPYADPIARQLYQRRYKRRPEVRERHKLAVRASRAGRREHSPTPEPIQELQRALSAWRPQ